MANSTETNNRNSIFVSILALSEIVFVSVLKFQFSENAKIDKRNPNFIFYFMKFAFSENAKIDKKTKFDCFWSIVAFPENSNFWNGVTA